MPRRLRADASDCGSERDQGLDESRDLIGRRSYFTRWTSPRGLRHTVSGTVRQAIPNADARSTSREYGAVAIRSTVARRK